MKTLVVVAIAVLCALGIMVAVFVLGGAYQQELFKEYMEDFQDTSQRQQNPIDMPSFDVP